MKVETRYYWEIMNKEGNIARTAGKNSMSVALPARFCMFIQHFGGHDPARLVLEIGSYQRIIEMLKHVGVIREENHLLTWMDVDVDMEVVG